LPDFRKIMISVPDALLREVDAAVNTHSGSRSELIRTALRMYLDEMRKRKTREALKAGYIEMGALNLELAEGGPLFEEASRTAEAGGK
jgi:CopG family transcriptional regulator/antitoxin EndoAI